MDVHALSSTGKAICLVVGGEDAVEGPVRAAAQRDALELARRGWQVHVLFCGRAGERELRGARGALAAAGVAVARLDDMPVPAECRAPNGTPGCGPALYASNIVRHALEAMHRRRHFDAVVFPCWQALGFRSVQAKRAGTAFEDVTLAVRLDVVDQWVREAEKRWPTAGDLFLDYCERYTWENADRRIGESDYLAGEARRMGWDLRLHPAGTGALTADEAEVVFVGATATPAALSLFLDAAVGMDPDARLTVILPAAPRTEVFRAAAQARSRLGGRRHRILPGMDRRRVLEYVAEGPRIAVFCEPSETVPPAVRDCIVNGLPFVAPRPRWLPGRLSDAAAPDAQFYDAGGIDAARRLCDALNRRQVGRSNLAAPESPPAERSSAAPSRPAGGPAATVAVTHYNLGRYLPETLASLAAQTCRDLEVLVIDDGSTCDFSRRVWEGQRALYPRFHFLRQPNAGLGAARNRALAEARGEFFIPVDADNLAAPGMVEVFVRAMRHNPDAAAMTCFFAAFEHSADVRRGRFLYQYCPTGGPHPAACAFNVYGDANAAFRASDLRAAGGFVEDRATYCHDWETFVKLARAGRRIGVVPEHLFYYRRRPDGMAAVMTRGGTDVYPFVQRMLTSLYVGEADADAKLIWTALAASLLRDAAAEAPAPSARRRLRRLLGGAVRRAVALFAGILPSSESSGPRAGRAHALQAAHGVAAE